MDNTAKYLVDFLQTNQFVHAGNWELCEDEKIVFSPLLKKNNGHCVYHLVRKAFTFWDRNNRPSVNFHLS